MSEEWIEAWWSTWPNRAMNRCLYGFLCIFGIEYIYGKSRSSSLGSIPNEVRTDLWLSITSDAEKSVRLYVGFPGSKLRQITKSVVFTQSLMFNVFFVECQHNNLCKVVKIAKLSAIKLKNTTHKRLFFIKSCVWIYILQGRRRRGYVPQLSKVGGEWVCAPPPLVDYANVLISLFALILWLITQFVQHFHGSDYNLSIFSILC